MEENLKSHLSRMPAVTQSCHRGRMKAEMWCWRARLMSREGIRPVRAASPALPARCPAPAAPRRARTPAPGCLLPRGCTRRAGPSSALRTPHPRPPRAGVPRQPLGEGRPGAGGGSAGHGGRPRRRARRCSLPAWRCPSVPRPLLALPAESSAPLGAGAGRGRDTEKRHLHPHIRTPRPAAAAAGTRLGPAGTGRPRGPAAAAGGEGGACCSPRSPAPGPPGRRCGSGSGGRGLLDGAGAVTGLGR